MVTVTDNCQPKLTCINAADIILKIKALKDFAFFLFFIFLRSPKNTMQVPFDPCVWTGVTCEVTGAERPAALTPSLCFQHPHSQRWEWMWRSEAVVVAVLQVSDHFLIYFGYFGLVTFTQLLCKPSIIRGKIVIALNSCTFLACFPTVNRWR